MYCKYYQLHQSFSPILGQVIYTHVGEDKFSCPNIRNMTVFLMWSIMVEYHNVCTYM